MRLYILMCFKSLIIAEVRTMSVRFRPLDNCELFVTENVYKFKVGNRNTAERWCYNLQQAASGQDPPLPINLMSFE